MRIDRRAQRWTTRVLALSAAAALSTATLAQASWSDRTTLTFSVPVMIPGATLQPGSYIFELLDLQANRHMVQVTSQDESKVIATMQAVPVKRAETTGATVLKFNPTDAGAPPALKAWYYPGTIYGHQFIYPEEQAQLIAQRTKTLVLSEDVKGSDAGKGTLRVFDPSGNRAEWRDDSDTLREWSVFQKDHAARAATYAGGTGDHDSRRSTAPMIAGQFKAMRVTVGALEEDPRTYTAKTISVDAEVEKVLGPRLFTIDEPNWIDLDGEILVHVPTVLAALVREDDRVTITGTVEPYVRGTIEREWGWIGDDPSVDVHLTGRPVLVASRIVGGDSNRALVIQTNPAGAPPAARDADANMPPVASLSALATGDEMIGRRVALQNVRVDRVVDGQGFYVEAQDTRVFVRPASDERLLGVGAGDLVSIKGVVLQLPDQMRDRVTPPAGAERDIYVFATDLDAVDS